MRNAVRLQQGPTLSIVARYLSWQSSIQDTPLAQGNVMPIFGECCQATSMT